MQDAYSRIQTGKAPHVLHFRALSSGRRDLQLIHACNIIPFSRPPYALYGRPLGPLNYPVIPRATV
jgi:hypothetical protein